MSITQHYKGAVSLEFNEAKHTYTVNLSDNALKIASGVTSILGVIAKPALVPWAAKLTAERCKELLTLELTTSDITEFTPAKIEKICEQAKKAVREKKDTAADIGHLVHAAVEAFVKEGTVPEIANEEAKKAFGAFMEWWTTNKVEPLKSEVRIYSKSLNYAGTCDFIGLVNGKKYLIDWKTSSGIYDEFFFQTSAYQFAYQEEFPEEQFAGNMIVNIRKTGELETRETDQFQKNFEAFKAAHTLYQRINELKLKV